MLQYLEGTLRLVLPLKRFYSRHLKVVSHSAQKFHPRFQIRRVSADANMAKGKEKTQFQLKTPKGTKDCKMIER